MRLDAFVQIEHGELQRWRDWYARHHEADPESYPIEMSPAAWFDQYLCWCDLDDRD